MIRRILVSIVCLPMGLFQVGLAAPAQGDDQAQSERAAESKPLSVPKGPHLLLDDYWIGKSSGVERKAIPAKRFLSEPVVTGKEHRNWQPFFTVLHDPAAPPKQRFKLWYNAYLGHEDQDAINGFLESKQDRCVLGYLESEDGVHWPTPFRQLKSVTPILYDASVIDEGPRFPRPSERFKMLYWHDKPDKNGKIGPHVAFSSDGLEWTQSDGNLTVIPNRIDGSWYAAYDPLRQRYFLIGKIWKNVSWTNAEGRKITKDVRTYGISYSQDFKRWTEQRVVFSPDQKDLGITDWYGCAGFQTRGDLTIAFLQVLRDDLSAAGTPQQAIAENMGNPGAGFGYTVMAWTRDGETWHRDRHTDPFFEPDPRVGTWDHAIAWIASSANVGDDVYLYYAGYRWGHKHNRPADRQIGLVKVKRDRYVAREAGEAAGSITTPLVLLDVEKMTLNADAANGEVRVQVTDESGKPYSGFGFEDCRPVKSDALAAPVEWKQPMATLKGKTAHLEFSIKNARLFAFETQ